MGRQPSGKGSTFVPRDLLKPADAFGHVSRPLEVAASEPKYVRQVLGAQLQHLVMSCLREEIRRAGITVRQLASRHQMSADRLYRVMRGESMIQITDLAAFSREFPRLLEVANRFLQRPDVSPAEVSRRNEA